MLTMFKSSFSHEISNIEKEERRRSCASWLDARLEIVLIYILKINQTFEVWHDIVQNYEVKNQTTFM